jgi:hypothetical protein
MKDEFREAAVIVILDRDERDRKENGLLEKPGRVFVVTFDQQYEEFKYDEVPWRVAQALNPDEMRRAVDCWRQRNPHLVSAGPPIFQIMTKA